MEKLVYTVEETGRILGIGRSSAYEAIRTGQIPSIRIGRRLLVPMVAIERLLKAGRSATEGRRNVPVEGDLSDEQPTNP